MNLQGYGVEPKVDIVKQPKTIRNMNIFNLKSVDRQDKANHKITPYVLRHRELLLGEEHACVYIPKVNGCECYPNSLSLLDTSAVIKPVDPLFIPLMKIIGTYNGGSKYA